MKRRPPSLGGLALVVLALPAAAAVNIGLVTDGPGEDWPEFRRLGQEEIAVLTRGEFEVCLPEEKTLVGDGTLAGVEAAFARLLADPQVDIVVAGGIIASHLAARRQNLPKPVIAPLVIDPQLQGIPPRGLASGADNLNYLTFPADLRQDLRAFRQLVPFTRLALLLDRSAGEAIPGLPDYYREAASAAGVEAQIVSVERRAPQVLEALPVGVEAVFIPLPLKLPPEEFAHLAAGLRERHLPSFSAVGTAPVEQGLLAGLHQEADVGRLVRRVALNIQRILSGEAPGSLPVVFSRSQRLVIDMATARAIGVYPSWKVLTEARLLNQTPEPIARHLTLTGAIQEALQVNLDLAASARAVAAGEQEVRRARSRLLPQLEVAGSGLLIDEQGASPVQTGRSFTGSGSLAQVVYAEPAWAEMAIQHALQRSRQAEGEQRRLEVVQEAATAYLNVLRAKTFARVQKDNLELTHSNLEVALVRQSIGVAGAVEVFRWESQLATDRQRLIEANARHNQAEIALNRVLHRPLEEPFSVAETGLYDESLITCDPRFVKCIDNPHHFEIFRAFLAQEGLACAPELQRLDASIAAQERGLESARRAFWSPTAALQGSLATTLARGGAGAERENPAGDRYWTLGLDLRLPLSTGGARLAASVEAREELERLRLERQALAERVEQRIRAALHQAGASYAGIGLSEEAAAAAHQGLELVEEAYGRGAVSILELLDAQNAAIAAAEGSANAVYNFLVDLMEVERALGKFYFSATPQERDQFFARLEKFFAEQEDEE